MLKTFVESLRYYWSTCDNWKKFFKKGGIGKKPFSEKVDLTSEILTIAGGYFHSLAVKDDGTVWTWGYNKYGQLGNGTNSDNNVPVQVSGLTGITAIAEGRDHSLSLKDDGTVWTWGNNKYGQLGNETDSDSDVPVRVSMN